jgi:Tfp pilus assembly protein PilV
MITWSHARARRTDRQAGKPIASERGETLIEVMCTVVLLGTGFVAILSAIFTATRVSDTSQNRTQASTYVQAYAEALLQPANSPPASPGSTYVPQDSYTYQPCAAPETYNTAGLTTADYGLKPGYTAKITKIRYLVSINAGTGQPVWSSPSFTVGDAGFNNCYGAYYTTRVVKDISGNDRVLGYDRGLQEITVQIDSGARRDRIVDTLVIVKRDQRCPTTYDNADLGPC